MQTGTGGAHEAGNGNTIFRPDEMAGIAGGTTGARIENPRWGSRVAPRGDASKIRRPDPMAIPRRGLCAAWGSRPGAYSYYAQRYDLMKFGHMRCDG